MSFGTTTGGDVGPTALERFPPTGRTGGFSQEEVNAAVADAARSMAEHTGPYDASRPEQNPTDPDKYRYPFEGPSGAEFNSEYWQSSGHGLWTPKPGVRPSEAMNDLLNQPGRYTFDCNAADNLAENLAAMKLMGADGFDRFVGDHFQIGQNPSDRQADPISTRPVGDSELPLAETTMDGEAADPGASLPVGAHVYFTNPDASAGQRFLGWGGLNAVKVGPDRYYGVPAGTLSYQQTVDLFNAHRRPGATESASILETWQSDAAAYQIPAANGRRPGRE